MGLFKELRDHLKESRPSTMDQIRGTGRAIRKGGLAGGMSPLAIRREAKQVKRERSAYEAKASLGRDGYFSKYQRGRIDVLEDKNGMPTSVYPHVHIVHNDSEGKIRIVASSSVARQLEGTGVPPVR